MPVMDGDFHVMNGGLLSVGEEVEGSHDFQLIDEMWRQSGAAAQRQRGRAADQQTPYTEICDDNVSMMS